MKKRITSEHLEEKPPEAVRKNSFGAAVWKLLRLRGWEIAKLASLTDIDRTLISRHMHGHLHPSLRLRREYAKAFGMDIAAFEALWRRAPVQQTRGGPGIPVINQAPAGAVVDYQEHGVDSGQGRFYLSRGEVLDPSAFAVIVAGDSMADAVNDGDYAIFAPMDEDGNTLNRGTEVGDGHIVFVRFAEAFRTGCTIAYMHRVGGDRIELRKHNGRKYSTIACRTRDIARLAALVELRRVFLKAEVQFADDFPSSAGAPGKDGREASRGEESQATPPEWSD